MLPINVPYRLSRYCKIFRKDEVAAFYHSLSMKVLYIRADILAALKDLTTGITPSALLARGGGSQDALEQILGAFAESGFIVPVTEDEDKPLRKIQDQLLGRPMVEMMYLLITDQCNLRCSYCFLKTYTPADFQPKKMDAVTARKAVDLFVRVAKKCGSKDGSKVIHLYGGEPLSNWPTFRAVVEYVNLLRVSDEVARRIKLVTVTNGTLVTPEIAAFLKENGIAVGISIDGPSLATNQHRRFASGKGSFHEAVRGYRYLCEAGVEVGISCTLVPESLANFPETLRCLLEEIGIQGTISFNILHHNPGIPITEDYLRGACRAIISAFEIFREKGIYEERMMRKITPFVEKKIMLYDCGGCGQQLAVSPDGKVGTCHDCLRDNRHIAATVDDMEFNPLESKVFIEWSKRSPFNMPECFDCEAIALCGGGCPVDAEAKDGSIWAVDTRFCVHSKMVLEWMIWDQYSHLSRKLIP